MAMVGQPRRPIAWEDAPDVDPPRPRRGKGASDIDADPARDILEDYPAMYEEGPGGLVAAGEADEEAGGSSSSAGPLARRMWLSARRNMRNEEFWGRYSQKVLSTAALLGPQDVLLIFFAYARVKYRDLRALDMLSPLLLKHLDSFSCLEVILLMNAHKKLEYQRIDNLKLLLSTACDRRNEWTGRHIALACNAVAHFYIYHPPFWRAVSVLLPKILWSMNALEVSNLIAAMARVDRRDLQSLVLIARMCRRCAKRNLFSQETLAVAVNGFAKLDFNHPALTKHFEEAVLMKLDRALALGSDYRKSSLRDVDVFDVQALVLLSHSMICLVGTSDEIAQKLLTLVSWSKDELSPFQRRTMKTTFRLLRGRYKRVLKGLPPDVRSALNDIDFSKVEVPTSESRWLREMREVLQKMDVKVELKATVDDQVLDLLLPTSNAVILGVGPYSYYTSSTIRTAYSKLHQRLLEAEGYTCMVVPYYEWSELKTEEDKMVYLWSLGRRVAAQNREEREAQTAPSLEAAVLLPGSDLSDADTGVRRLER